MRVWVTRDEEIDGPLCTALRAVGLSPVLEPVLERRALTDAAEDIAALAPADWLVLTSPFAVQCVNEAVARVPRIAVVGESSKAAALQRGFRVELVGEGDGKSLFRELHQRVREGKVCYPRSSLVEPPQPWAAVEIISPVLYETVPRAFDRAILEKVDVIAVASASAVRAVGPADKPFASIGSPTSAALRALGVEPWLQAPTPSFPALAQAIADQASDSRHHRA